MSTVRKKPLIIGLGVAQIIISIILIPIGASSYYQLALVGMFGGVWILVPGILCVCSGVFPTNKLLVGVNLGFTVITLIGSAAGIFFSALWIDWVKDRLRWITDAEDIMYTRKVIKVYTVILVFMIVEIIVSFAVSILSCRGNCGCCTDDCCAPGVCDSSMQEAAVVQPAPNFQYAQVGQSNQQVAFQGQPMYYHAQNQQVVMQPMNTQGQPGTPMMNTRPQIPTSYMQQPTSQANPPHVSNTTVPNTRFAQTPSDDPPPYSP